MARRQGLRKGRMGALPPRYSFALNPRAQVRFTKCPRCEAKTRVRKISLVIHINSIGLITLRKTCRLCVNCDTLIAHQAEIEALIDTLRRRQGVTDDAREYFILGTVEPKVWRRGLSGSVSVDEVVRHMADFKAHLQIEYTPGGWVRSTAGAG